VAGHRQADRRQHGRVPGSEVLGREVRAGDLAQVVVDVGGGHVVGSARAVAPGQELIATPVPPFQAPHDHAEPLVGNGLLALDAALGRVLERQLPAPAGDMLAADRGQAEGLVLGGVLLAPGPEEPQIDQPERGRHYPLPVQASPLQLGQDLLADVRQRAPELGHPVKLALVLLLPPPLVIQVLPPPRRVDTGRLDVAGGI
jgi:hypothetical protein